MRLTSILVALCILLVGCDVGYWEAEDRIEQLKIAKQTGEEELAHVTKLGELSEEEAKLLVEAAEVQLKMLQTGGKPQ